MGIGNGTRSLSLWPPIEMEDHEPATEPQQARGFDAGARFQPRAPHSGSFGHVRPSLGGDHIASHRPETHVRNDPSNRRTAGGFYVLSGTVEGATQRISVAV